MKHLPNLLTLANLFCGCIAIAFILNSQPYLANVNGESYWVSGTEQAYLGGIFIFIAAICDLLDGAAARALRVFSPIGKDLDSLADLVSFGVAPSMILFKMLWGANMSEPNAMDASMWMTAPAFLIASFGALRLARFNITSDQQSTGFTGMPIPAVGLFIASFPLINFYNPFNIGSHMQSKWMLLLIIAILCWLMVSKIRFIKLMPSKWQMKYVWPQVVLIVVTAVAIPVLKIAAIPIAFILYILLSFIYKQPEQV
ncbi:MAG: CDP-alcohol phosphatidyltransferase family protein [Bacteroidota bacterium]